MNCILGLLALLLLGQSKVVISEYPVRWLPRHNNFMYLTKMDFGVGEGTAKIVVRLIGAPASPLPPIHLGLLLDESFEKFQAVSTCEQRRAMLSDDRQLSILGGSQPHVTNFHIEQSVREHYWYFYLFSCSASYDKEKDNFGLRFQVEIEMLNNGSHFGQDEQIMWIYVVAFLVAVALTPRNLYKLYQGWVSGDRDWAHIAVCTGIVTLIIAYFYKLIDLSCYWLTGEGAHILDLLFLASRTLSECIIINLLLLVGWGWTITYLNGGYEDLYIPIGAMVSLLHIIAATLGKITDDGQHKNHHFDCVTGWILLIVRTVIVVGFLIGVSKTYEASRAKSRRFVREFGVLGVLYLAGPLVAVLICQLFVAPYVQHRVITCLTEISHALANGLLTYMITSNKSAYASLDYSHRTVFTPLNGKVF